VYDCLEMYEVDFHELGFNNSCAMNCPNYVNVDMHFIFYGFYAFWMYSVQ